MKVKIVAHEEEGWGYTVLACESGTGHCGGWGVTRKEAFEAFCAHNRVDRGALEVVFDSDLVAAQKELEAAVSKICSLREEAYGVM